MSSLKLWVVNKILGWLGVTQEFLHVQAKINSMEADAMAIINKQLDFQEQLTDEVRRCMRAVYMGDDPVVLELTAKKEKVVN